MPLLAPVMTTVRGDDISGDYTDAVMRAAASRSSSIVNRTLESSFLLDPEQTAQQKRRRERHFHVVEVPALRLLGFAIITLLVCLHELLSPPVHWRVPIAIGGWLLVYGLASWAALYLFYAKVARPNLGVVFLGVDIFAFAWVIYMTGGDQSWLLLLLLIRVADQA